MNGALVSDRHKAGALSLVEEALQLDDALDVVEHSRLLGAFGAVLGVDAPVAQPHHNAIERPFLPRGIQAERHRGAGAEAHKQELVRPRAGVGTPSLLCRGAGSF